MITDAELDHIEQKTTENCYFQGTFIHGVMTDIRLTVMPRRLVKEIRELQARVKELEDNTELTVMFPPKST